MPHSLALLKGVPGKRWLRSLGVAVAITILAMLVSFVIRNNRLEAKLVIAEPDDLVVDAGLMDFAVSRAKPAYAANCAGCHGEDLRGRQDKGAPPLKGGSSLYDSDSVLSLERTILYGVRSGHAMARNVTDMPAMGLTKQLSPAQIRDVAAYVLSLSSGVRDAATVRGKQIYQNEGVCYDCHNADGSGNPDYGAPAFRGVWLHGGDLETIYRSIYDGRHGLCPAWISKLSPVAVRALALYLFEVSHDGTPAFSPAPGHSR
jgi:cytochrome c oxidase cbb3-type subunit 3